ncbi:Putative pentatricopeptide repeat-containing protein At1g53330 [Linum grandiflorum]
MQKDPKLALELFRNPNPAPTSQASTKPFRHSLLSYDLIITKLGSAKMFADMEEILSQLKSETRFAPKEVIFCNIIKFYGRARRLEDAVKLFDEIPSFHCRRTTRSFNSLLNAFLMCKEVDRMMEFYTGIEEYGRPDACTYNILIRGCFLKGSVDHARKLFDEMLCKRIFPTVATLVIFVKGLCLADRLEEAVELKNDMVKLYGVTPNAFIYSSLIKSLCEIGELIQAFQLKDEMVTKGIELDSPVYSTLISGLFEAGRKEEALELWQEMNRSDCTPDTVTYNVMINGFCMNMDFKAAYEMLDKMSESGCKPDVVSYNIILRGLCKDGRLVCANELFDSMTGRGCLPDVISYRILFRGLCDGMQLKDAALILDEMIFKGFTPHTSSVSAFVEKLCEEKNKAIMLWSVLDTLAMGNAIDRNTWAVVVDAVAAGEDTFSMIHHRVESLVVS